MNTLTDKQKELLRSNKEDLKAITLEWCKYGNGIRKSLADDFDSFASQFEPEWKILSRKSHYDGVHAGNENCIKFKCDIHSVQYKSETPLTVGDDIRFLINKKTDIIKSFHINNENKLFIKCVNSESEPPISEVEKIDRKLRFVTNGDGEEIFESDGNSDCYYFHINNPSTLMVAKFQDIAGYKKGYTYFKSKEKATEYVLLNSPKLSVNDVMEIWGYGITADTTKQKLINLVKSKQ